MDSRDSHDAKFHFRHVIDFGDMKRLLEEVLKVEEGKYPDFTALYDALDEAYCDRVVSYIPKGVWANVFHHLFTQDKIVRYSHYWNTLIQVSKLFRTTVYEDMKDIYINVQVMGCNPSSILERFKQVETLRVPCFRGELKLPMMPYLKRLKIRNPVKSQCRPCYPDGACTRFPSLKLLEPQNLPLLTTLSYRNGCLYSENYPPAEITQKLTKITHNKYIGLIDKPEKVPLLTELNIIKYRGDVNIDLAPHKNLKKIYVGGTFNKFGNYTGECVIRYHNAHRKEGQMIDGKRVGLWRVYGYRKKLLHIKVYDNKGKKVKKVVS